MTAMQTNLMQCAAVWSEHWQADPPPPLQPLQQCWQHSYVYFPNTTSGYDTEHMHSTSLVDHGEAVLSGTCHVKPLYGSWPLCCSLVSGSWQSSYSPSHLYVEQQLFFFRSSESSLPWGAMLNFQWTVWESESDNTKFNTPARVRWHRGEKIANLGPIFTFSLGGILTFVASGLDINGCVLCNFEGTANLHCYTRCTLTTLHCSKVSVLQCCHMKIYNKHLQKCEGCAHFCAIL